MGSNQRAIGGECPVFDLARGVVRLQVYRVEAEPSQGGKHHRVNFFCAVRTGAAVRRLASEASEAASQSMAPSTTPSSCPTAQLTNDGRTRPYWRIVVVSASNCWSENG